MFTLNRNILRLLYVLMQLQITFAGSFAHSKLKHNCASPHRVRRDDLGVLPMPHLSKDVASDSNQHGNAAYFSGGEIIRFRKFPVDIHHPEQFTLEMWIHPEGGQESDVSIVKYFDQCVFHNNVSRGWSIGLKENEEDKDLRIYFRLQTDRAKKLTTITAHDSVKPNVWMHVAASFNGTAMKLFINQAKVAVSHLQTGPVSMRPFTKCEVLELGGDSRHSRMFRGAVDEFRVWNIAKLQREITEDIFSNHWPHTSKALDLRETFDHPNDYDNTQFNYDIVTGSYPELIQSTVPEDLHRIGIRKPLCGITVCDNPEVVRSYLQTNNLRRMKTLRYRIINVAEDDGKNPLVSHSQIKMQHTNLNKAFKSYNISWKLTEKEIRNTSLRRRTILHNCDAEKVGDDKCQDECRHPATGNDGGDCDQKYGGIRKCDSSKVGNGQCDLECNRYYHRWDGGDCCNPKLTDTAKTCFNPKSPQRAYLSLKEFKTLINLDNSKYLNVFLVEWGEPEILGIATFPWEKTVHGLEGGVVLKTAKFGKPTGGVNDMIHEFGHVLGLWHVHRGVSEVEHGCDDPCFETHPSMELGDLCSDTAPTPQNGQCHDPDTTVCGKNIKYKKTPYHNYMSYAKGTCSNQFTPQQIARMHCYIDMVYQVWVSTQEGPSAIPLPPRILARNKQSLKIGWFTPIGMGKDFSRRQCQKCELSSRTLGQFATSADSPRPKKPSGVWAPYQAKGAPDVQLSCLADSRVWLADHLSQLSCDDCYIDLGFDKAVVPTAIKIWVSYKSKSSLKDIQLMHKDKTTTSLGKSFS